MQKKRMWNRVLAGVLALLMVFGSMDLTVFVSHAEGSDYKVAVSWEGIENDPEVCDSYAEAVAFIENEEEPTRDYIITYLNKDSGGESADSAAEGDELVITSLPDAAESITFVAEKECYWASVFVLKAVESDKTLTFLKSVQMEDGCELEYVSATDGTNRAYSVAVKGNVGIDTLELAGETIIRFDIGTGKEVSINDLYIEKSAFCKTGEGKLFINQINYEGDGDDEIRFDYSGRDMDEEDSLLFLTTCTDPSDFPYEFLNHDCNVIMEVIEDEVASGEDQTWTLVVKMDTTKYYRIEDGTETKEFTTWEKALAEMNANGSEDTDYEVTLLNQKESHFTVNIDKVPEEGKAKSLTFKWNEEEPQNNVINIKPGYGRDEVSYPLILERGAMLDRDTVYSDLRLQGNKAVLYVGSYANFTVGDLTVSDGAMVHPGNEATFTVNGTLKGKVKADGGREGDVVLTVANGALTADQYEEAVYGYSDLKLVITENADGSKSLVVADKNENTNPVDPVTPAEKEIKASPIGKGETTKITLEKDGGTLDVYVTPSYRVVEMVAYIPQSMNAKGVNPDENSCKVEVKYRKQGDTEWLDDKSPNKNYNTSNFDGDNRTKQLTFGPYEGGNTYEYLFSLLMYNDTDRKWETIYTFDDSLITATTLETDKDYLFEIKETGSVVAAYACIPNGEYSNLCILAREKGEPGWGLYSKDESLYQYGETISYFSVEPDKDYEFALGTIPGGTDPEVIASQFVHTSDQFPATVIATAKNIGKTEAELEVEISEFSGLRTSNLNVKDQLTLMLRIDYYDRLGKRQGIDQPKYLFIKPDEDSTNYIFYLTDLNAGEEYNIEIQTAQVGTVGNDQYFTVKTATFTTEDSALADKVDFKVGPKEGSSTELTCDISLKNTKDAELNESYQYAIYYKIKDSENAPEQLGEYYNTTYPLAHDGINADGSPKYEASTDISGLYAGTEYTVYLLIDDKVYIKEASTSESALNPTVTMEAMQYGGKLDVSLNGTEGEEYTVKAYLYKGSKYSAIGLAELDLTDPSNPVLLEASQEGKLSKDNSFSTSFVTRGTIAWNTVGSYLMAYYPDNDYSFQVEILDKDETVVYQDYFQIHTKPVSLKVDADSVSSTEESVKVTFEDYDASVDINETLTLYIYYQKKDGISFWQNESVYIRLEEDDTTGKYIYCGEKTLKDLSPDTTYVMKIASTNYAEGNGIVYATEEFTTGKVGIETGTLAAGQINWTYDANTGVLTVSGDGNEVELKGTYREGNAHSPFEEITEAHEVTKIVFDNCRLTGDAEYLFYDLSGILEIDCSGVASGTPGLDTAEVTSMQEMFSGCESLLRIRFGDDFKTSKVENMNDMFGECRSLQSLDLSGFDASKAYCYDIISDCTNLTELITPRDMGDSNLKLPNPFVDSSNNVYTKIPSGMTSIKFERITSTLQPKNLTWDKGIIYWEMDEENPYYEIKLYQKLDGKREYSIKESGGYHGKDGNKYYFDWREDIAEERCDATYRVRIRPRSSDGIGEEGLWSDFSPAFRYDVPSTKLESSEIEAGVIPYLATFKKVDHADLYKVGLYKKAENPGDWEYYVFEGEVESQNIASYHYDMADYKWDDIAQTRIRMNQTGIVGFENVMEEGKQYYWKVYAISYDLENYAISEEAVSEPFTYTPSPKGTEADGKFYTPQHVEWKDNWRITFVSYARNCEGYRAELKKEGDSEVHELGWYGGSSGSGVNFEDHDISQEILELGSGNYQIRVKVARYVNEESEEDSEWTEWTAVKSYTKPTAKLDTTTAKWDAKRPGFITFDPVTNSGHYEIRLFELDENGEIPLNEDGGYKKYHWTTAIGQEDGFDLNYMIKNPEGKYRVKIIALSSDIDHYLNSDEGPASEIFDCTKVTKVKYDSPTNLKWDNYTAMWTLPDLEADNRVWVEYCLYQQKAGGDVLLYKGQSYDKPASADRWLNCASYIMESGEYYFTVQVKPYSNFWKAESDVAKSDSITYTKPSDVLGASTASWSDTEPGAVTITPVAGAYAYYTELYKGDEFITSDIRSYDNWELSFAGWIEEKGPGKYYVRVRALSENIDMVANGPMSEFSVAYDTEPKSYTVTFNVDGGSKVDAQSVEHGKKATKPAEDPTKEGYDFAGWYVDEELTTEFDFTKEITEDTTVYAKWTIKKYDVTFSVDGGSKVDAQSVEHGKKATKPAEDPTKEGYDFAGWYADEELTTEFDFTKEITGDTTVYAKWTIKEYDVTFSVDGGSKVDAQSVEHGKKATKPAEDPTKEGYDFAGWYADEELATEFDFTKEITEDTTVYAKWTIKKYDVTFSVDGGSKVDAQSVEHGKKATKPAEDPTKEGYDFAGWYADEELTTEFDFTKEITGDTTVYAKWTAVKVIYSITYMDGEEEMKGLTPVSYEEGTEAELPTTAEKEGYTFAGWFADKELTGEAVTKVNAGSKSDLVFYAKWIKIIKKYTITFEVNGGSAVEAQIVEEGNQAEEPAEPTKEGYDFAGWYADEELTIEFDFTKEISADITIYAKWTEEIGEKDFWVEEVKPQVYTGSAIKPEVKVYDGRKLLTLNVDYTITYKNNTKANDASIFEKAPTITVAGKGNYDGKKYVTFVISPKDITDEDVTVDEMLVKESAAVQQPVPTVKWGSKALKKKTDFTVDYPSSDDGAYQKAGVYTVVIKGVGNYTGTLEKDFTITDRKLLKNVKVTPIKEQKYTGEAITPDVELKDGNYTLIKGTDYELDYADNIEAGKATVTITGLENYYGTRSVNFTITGNIPMSKTELDRKLENKVYNGKEQEQEFRIRLKNSEQYLTENVDYTVSYQKNVNAGTATVVITGMGDYNGTVKKNFKITAYDLSNPKDSQTQDLIKDNAGLTVTYRKGGCSPEPELEYLGESLKVKTDFTVSYSNNKKAATITDAKKPTMIIKGKGNFKGKRLVYFNIQARDLSDSGSGVLLVAPDVKFKAKNNNYVTKPVLYDSNGKKLSAGTDYEKTYEFYDSEGNALEKNDRLNIGDTVTVVVTGKGSYEGKIKETYRLTEESFSSAKITIYDQFYTGEEICSLEAGDFKEAKIGKIPLTFGTDFEIIEGSFTNNLKKGKASVLIRGKGKYGGVKTVKFNIKAKPVESKES